MTLSELGKVVGANFAAVSMAIKRLERRSANDTSIREMQEKMVAMLNV